MAIAIERRIGAIDSTSRIRPSQGEATEFDVFLYVADA